MNKLCKSRTKTFEAKSTGDQSGTEMAADVKMIVLLSLLLSVMSMQ